MDLQSKRPSQKYTRFSVPTSQTPTPSVCSSSKNLKYGAGLGSAMPNSGTSSNIASTSSRTYRGSSTRNTSAPQPHPQLRYFNPLLRLSFLAQFDSPTGRMIAGLRWWRTLVPMFISSKLGCHSVPLLGPAISAKRLGISIVNAPSWTPISLPPNDPSVDSAIVISHFVQLRNTVLPVSLSLVQLLIRSFRVP
jgi:hypothetical protein